MKLARLTLRSKTVATYLKQYSFFLQKKILLSFFVFIKGTAERTNRTLLNHARCMLSSSGLPHEFQAKQQPNPSTSTTDACPNPILVQLMKAGFSAKRMCPAFESSVWKHSLSIPSLESWIRKASRACSSVFAEHRRPTESFFLKRKRSSAVDT